MKKLSNIISWILTILMLYIVWKNAHWSVALVLTVNTISLELVNRSFKALDNFNKEVINTIDTIYSIFRSIFRK